jgi:hypothetical protein
MGFFKKIFKSVKKGFKSIGKGIKSAFKKFGKFMNKIGIVGQLALMFTPIGGMMAGMFSKLGSAAGNLFGKVVGQAAGTAGTAAAGTAAAGTAAAGTAAAGTAAASSVASGTAAMLGGSTASVAGSGMLGSSNAIIRGAGKILEAGANFAKAGHSAFRTITDGIGSFVSEFSKTALKKIPGMEKIMPSLSSASDNFFTKSNVMVDGKMVSKSAWSTVQEKFVGNADLVTGAFEEKINLPKDATGAYEEAVGKGTASTGASAEPMKDGYRFPDNATTATPVSELGPVSAGTDASLLAPPQMSPVIVEGQGITSSQAINPVSGRPYVKSSIPKKIVEEKSYIEQLLGNAKTQVKEGFKDFKDKPMTTIFGEDPIATASDRFSGQLTKALAQRAAMGKPEGATVYYADIADFGQAYTAPYDSAEINDRAMQIQFGGADIFQQLPYGAGADVWQQQFRQSLGGRG